LRRALVAVLAFVPGLVPGRATAAPAPTPLVAKLPAAQLKLFALTYRSETGTVGEVLINDVPAIRFNGEGNSGSSSEVQAWLMPGTNTIVLNLDKTGGDSPELASVTLHGLAGPGFPGDENAIVNVAVKKGTTPGALRYRFELPEKQAPPVQLWKRAAVVGALTDADRKELDALATQLLSAMQKGDTAGLRKLWQFVVEERARATYGDPKQQLAAIDKMAPEMKKTFAKATVSRPLQYRLVGGARIVQITAGSGKPPIVVREKDGESSMPMSAAKIDGRWTLVP
jgi:hypothetical protein